MGTFDMSTGRYTPDADPRDVRAELEHEVTMRELGADPRLHPGETLAEVRRREAEAVAIDNQAARQSWEN